MTITGIAHVQMSMIEGGEETARRFYGDLLGLPEIARPPALKDRPGCWFRCGAQELHCGVDEPQPPARRHPALLTDDLDGLRATLDAAGVATEDDVPVPGYRRFHARDPFGNRLEFMQPVP